MRRFVHVALLVVMVISVRACGGAAAAEDRLAVVNRWIAEKTGLQVVQVAWQKTVRPGIAARTNSISDSLYQSTSRALDRLETTLDGMTGSIVGGVDTAINWTWNMVVSAFGSNQTQQPAPVQGPAPPANNSQDN